MFYIGTPAMIAGGVLLMALQGMSIYVFFMTLGFLGGVTLPLALLVHSIGLIVTLMYFRRDTAKDPYKAQRRERQLSSPWKIGVRTVIGLALFAGAVYGGYTKGMGPFSKTSSEKKIVQEAAESYLENKYNESFAVSEVRYIWAISSYSLKAHPEQNPHIEFSLDSSNGSPPRISNDTYLNHLWGSQLKDNLTPLVDEFYPDRAFIYTWVNEKDHQMVEKNYNNLSGENGLQISSQHVTLYVFADLTEDNLAEEKERVMTLIRRMPEVMSEGETELDIRYYPSNMNTPANMNKLKRDKTDKNFNQGKQTHMLRIDDISEITSVNDIEIRNLREE